MDGNNMYLFRLRSQFSVYPYLEAVEVLPALKTFLGSFISLNLVLIHDSGKTRGHTIAIMTVCQPCYFNKHPFAPRK